MSASSNDTKHLDKGSEDDDETGLAPQKPPGEQSHGGREGEVQYGYGRHGGSIAETGTRTDDPVGIEQVESSKHYKVSPKEASERQGKPPERV